MGFLLLFFADIYFSNKKVDNNVSMIKMLYYYGIDNAKGGLENFAKQLLPNVLLLDKEISIVIVSCYEDYSYRDYFESLGIKSIIIPNYKRHPLLFYRSLRRILTKRSDNSVFHANIMSYKNYLLFRAIRRSGIPSVITGHASSTTNVINKIIHIVGRYIYRKVGYRIVIEKNNFMFHKHYQGDVIINGFDVASFYYSETKRKELRQKYNMGNKIAIGLIGRISYLKNQAFMIDVMQMINDKNYHLYLAGTNQDQKILDYLVNNNIDNVTYIGEIDNVNEFYNALDLLVVPSISEGFGLVLYEGLANGLNAIISNGVPTPSLIKDNYLQLPLDKEKWVNAVHSLTNTDLSHQRPDGIEQYDIKETAKKYLSVYIGDYYEAI